MLPFDFNIFFRPRGIAVIGASRERGKLGFSVVYNLVNHHYDGAIYPVNPNADEVMGIQAYPAITDVPDPLDLAVIVVPAPYVESQLEACGNRGVPAVTIVSGGFREIGEEGRQREENLQAIARRYQIALLGPNCIGTIDTHTPLNSTFVTTGHPNTGAIGFLSQSGALAAAIIDWARGTGVGFSRIVSLGNQAGVTETDMLKALAEDRNTAVITAYVEGVSDGQNFLKLAAAVSQKKPIIALKAGRGKSGAKAVSSHTGALAGTEKAYEAAFRRAGILRPNNLEEMLDWARALSSQPLPKGKRVAVLTNAGGVGVLAVDALEMAGLELAPLTEATKAFLRQRVSPAASVENPVDILAGSGPATYTLCLDAVLADETVDAVVVMSAPQDWYDPIGLTEIVGEVGNTPLGRQKPILAVIMGLDAQGQEILQRRHIPNFYFPERIGSTLMAMWQRRQWLEAQKTTQKESPLSYDHTAARRAIAVKAQTAGWMTVEAVEALLGAYRVPVPVSALARTVEEAWRAAEKIGYPLAVKIVAPDLTHKSDVGGVRLNIKTPEALEAVCSELLARHDLGVEGVYLQQMATSLVKVIVGVVRDPQFGALVMVGSGGVEVELVGDVAFELAPLTRQQADEALNRTTVGRLLDGYRGKGRADRQALIDVIQAVAQMALDHPEIGEMEINPLYVMAEGEGVCAVDARVRLALSEQEVYASGTH